MFFDFLFFYSQIFPFFCFGESKGVFFLLYKNRFQTGPRPTWIDVSEGSGLLKITVILAPSCCLVVCIHGIGRMGSNRVRNEARSAFLDGLAVQS